MAEGKQTSEYGTWLSPISSKLATESTVKFEDLCLDINQDCQDTVYWSEVHFDENGRYVVCSMTQGQSEHVQWTPQDYNARTLVHEYGGGAFFVFNRHVYFSNFKDQRLYVQRGPDSVPEALTPEESGWRYANGTVAPKHQKIYIVREDHSQIASGKRKEPENTLVAIDMVSWQQTIIASGADFYASPCISPDGTKIAWTQWAHPNMPWDSTEIYQAELSDDGASVKPGSVQCVVGADNVSVMHPSFTPNGELLYIGDQSDWWNLYHVTRAGDHLNLCLREEEIGGPHWVFGDEAYAVDPKGSGLIVTSFSGNLGILDTKSRDHTALETPYSRHHYLRLARDGTVYCVAASPTSFAAVISVNIHTKQVKVIRESRSLSVDKGYLSVPKSISWPTGEGQTSHGYFYPPQNQDYSAPEGSLPPLLVKVHGGPTAATFNDLDLGIQYFTSRGFSVLDTNYRGSTGYGKEYRHRLKRMWGIYDVEDCCSGAQYLVNTNQVDSSRLCIDGGSAGGYTTLACLCFKNTFKAGASCYGIGDLAILAAETHKFESRYVEQLLAPLSPENQHIFDERSPIKHIDQFDCPIVLFQGDEDEIVPPNQAEMMFKAVKEKKIPCAFVLFEGEQHGFRKAENIQKCLDGEFSFYAQVFGFEAADKHCKLHIENL